MELHWKYRDDEAALSLHVRRSFSGKILLGDVLLNGLLPCPTFTNIL